MMKREEIRLKDTREELDRLVLPNAELDAAIMNGLLKGKQRKGKRSKRKPWIYSGMTAAVLLIGFVYLVNASPAFASYISKVPGMEGFIEIIDGDKSFKSAVENDYLEQIGISEEKDGITVTIDAAIKDESGMVLFYTVEADRNIDEAHFELKEITDGTGKSLLDDGAFSAAGSFQDLKKGEKQSQTLDFTFIDFSKVSEYNLTLHLHNQEFTFSFTLDNNAKKEIYEINQTVLVHGQAITIKDVTLHPLRADVQISVNEEQNSKHLYSFDDIRLVDGEGEVWGAPPNGMTASVRGKDRHLYLQSSYFERPEELYLEFSRIQALDKNKSKIVIDADSGKIIEAPDNQLTGLRVNGDEIRLDLHAPDWDSAYSGMNMIGSVLDGEGKEIEISTRFQEGDGTIGFAIPDLGKYRNPITIEAGAYPSWIEEDIKIRVK